MSALRRRVQNLERADGGFAGFAVVWVDVGQTLEQAKDEWEREHGPVGPRQWLIYNFSGEPLR